MMNILKKLRIFAVVMKVDLRTEKKETQKIILKVIVIKLY